MIVFAFARRSQLTVTAACSAFIRISNALTRWQHKTRYYLASLLSAFRRNCHSLFDLAAFRSKESWCVVDLDIQTDVSSANRNFLQTSEVPTFRLLLSTIVDDNKHCSHMEFYGVAFLLAIRLFIRSFIHSFIHSLIGIMQHNITYDQN